MHTSATGSQTSSARPPPISSSRVTTTSRMVTRISPATAGNIASARKIQ
jgi:hypothetical protein